MKVVALAVLALCAGCRIFRAEEWERRDRCAATLPVLRQEPERPYRVIKIVEGKNDNDLAWKACAERAHAVISARSESYETKVKAGFGVSAKTERSRLLEGEAIVFVDQSN